MQRKLGKDFGFGLLYFFLTVRPIQALSLVFFPHLHVSVPPFDYHLGDLLSAIIDFPPNMREDLPFMV